MVYNDIIVRADFVNERAECVTKIVPLAFQVTKDSPALHIGRVSSIVHRTNLIEYRCRIKGSDETAILYLDTSGGDYRWSVETDWDITKTLSNADSPNPPIQMLTKKDNSSDAAKRMSDSDELKITFGLMLIYGVLWAVGKFVLQPNTPPNDHFVEGVVFTTALIFAMLALMGIVEVGAVLFKRRRCRKETKQ